MKMRSFLSNKILFSIIAALFIVFFNQSVMAQRFSDSTYTDSIFRRSFSLENKSNSCSNSNFEIGLAFVYNNSSDDIKDEYGGLLLANYIGLKPWIANLTLQLSGSKFKIPFLADEKTLTFIGHVGFQYRFNRFGKIMPYIGSGIGFVSNSSTNNKLCDEDVFDPWPDENRDYCSNDYGHGLLFNLQVGSHFNVSRKFKLFLDVRYLITKPEMDVIITEYPSGNSYDGKQSYKMGKISITIGIIGKSC